MWLQRARMFKKVSEKYSKYTGIFIASLIYLITKIVRKIYQRAITRKNIQGCNVLAPLV